MVAQPIRPDPDPTVMTTQQLQREIAALRDLFDVRIDGMDKAVTLLEKFPTSIDVAIGHLQSLHEEKFKSVALQFVERDARTEQTTKDNKVAVDAAFAAAKEAVGEQNKSNALAIAKSEAGFTKQIDQIGILLNAVAKATDEKIDDLKTRLTTIEGQKSGSNDTWAWILGVVGVLIALAVYLKP